MHANMHLFDPSHNTNAIHSQILLCQTINVKALAVPIYSATVNSLRTLQQLYYILVRNKRTCIKFRNYKYEYLYSMALFMRINR